MRRTFRVAAMLAATVLTLGLSIGSASAAPDSGTTTGDVVAPLASGQRCNDISGSPLCIRWQRDTPRPGEGIVEVWYTKNSGPARFVNLYVASCGQPMVRVFSGTVAAGDTGWGYWDGYPRPGSCWVGYMRIGNSQWTTGQIIS